MATAFVIMNIASGLVLSIYGNGDAGSALVMNTNGFSANQLFTYDNATIKSTWNGRVLDIYQPQSMGSQVVLEDSNGQISQQWNINEDGTIVSALSLYLVMSAYENDPEPGTPVVVTAPYAGNSGQFFETVNQSTK